ncbi:MAG: class I SAM-dependent methyltransferase, partial [Acidimicrobiia bacterium]|nr:class I SAM-dependent methyltransferase [Acidimicrobiia bacterium]
FGASVAGVDAGRQGIVPVSIAPGRSVTVPVPLRVPRRPGRAVVDVGEGLLRLDVDVVRGGDEPWSALERKRRRLGYEAEHRQATELVASVLPPGGRRRLLEIGGGTHPQLAWVGGHDVVDVDISLPLLELGSLWFAARAPADVAAGLAFLCADATTLPFDDGTFDAVAMYATLHHFARPEALLAECRRVVGPTGVVAILCEPVGATLEEPDIIRDLAKGINEQVFTIDEYRRIAGAAGLDLVTGVLAGGSLQAVLRPAAASGETFDVAVATGVVR